MPQENKKLGVIDLGTNTFNLLIVERHSQNSFNKITSHRIPVMLGEGTISSNLISDKAFERGISAINDFSKILSENNVSEVRALATSALRTSKNSNEFVTRVLKDFGIKIEVISGDREAELIFIGNNAAANLNENYSLIMDIGGGSTEFIIANNKGILWKNSYLLGAARLLARFKPEDPISVNTIQEMESYFEKELDEFFKESSKIKLHELIGSSGAFDSFVEMIDIEFSSMSFSEGNPVYKYNINQFYHLSERILKSTMEERLKMNGLISMRAEMIVVSVLLTNYILKKTGVINLRSTTWSLKEGAVIQWLNETQ